MYIAFIHDRQTGLLGTLHSLGRYLLLRFEMGKYVKKVGGKPYQNYSVETLKKAVIE